MNMSGNYNYSHRYLARIIIKAETPLAVGSGKKDLTDKLIIRDVNNLPYIPGTSIAGIIRHSLGEEKAHTFFGYSSIGGKDDLGKGSEIIFSSANIVDEDKSVVEGLLFDKKSDYLKIFENLPVRQHVAIDAKGVNKKRGKYDEEVVYKGAHFCFEIEMLSDGSNEDDFSEVLRYLKSDTVRMGSGTRNGLGEISVVECKKAILDLTKPEDLQKYLDKTSSLNDPFWEKQETFDSNPETETGWYHYEIILEPEDFFLFGSGFGNDKADITPVTEKRINWEWTKGKPTYQTDYILIPGTSVKGAISHRVAFHYNKINGYFVGDDRAKTGIDNEAVRALFGYTMEQTNISKRGNTIFSDMIEYAVSEQPLKILNHVAIDRFTGGAIEGALFSEEAVYGKGKQYKLEIKVSKVAFADTNVKKAFEAALTDLTTGMLPLGGGVNRGNGCFTGKWEIKEKEDR